MDKLSFETIANGALQERFEDAMQEVLDNIADPNTEAKKVRKISLTLSLHPNEDRDFANVSFIVKTATAEPKAVETKFILDRDQGKNVAAEVRKHHPGQMAIDDLTKDNDKVVQIQKSNSN